MNRRLAEALPRFVEHEKRRMARASTKPALDVDITRDPECGGWNYRVSRGNQSICSGHSDARDVADVRAEALDAAAICEALS